MANTIRLKRASGSDPGASDLVTGELAVRTDTGKLFTKKDDNSVAEIGVTGNAATATKLETARTIAGVSFDGSANISLNNNAITNGAGYITATLTNEQVQDIVGGMLTGNTETGITVTYQDGDGTIDFVVGTLNQDTTGNAATATTATNANHISVADNEDTNENNLIPFIEDASATGNVGLESDGHLFYNPSEGKLTSPAFAGNGAALTNLSGGNISSGTISASRIPTLNQNTTGSAATLTTARNIGGVSFDGSANINLPGVNTSGNQDTSGNAATATKLATARTIAGVSFDGSANISLNNNAITNGAGYITSADGGNAATLDSIDSSQFLRSDADDSTNNVITITNGLAFGADAKCPAALSSLSDGSTITVDFTSGIHHSVTLGGNRTFGDPSNTGSAVGQSGSIFITQDGTGSRTASFHADYKFVGGTAPTLSTAANAVDRIDYVVKASNVVHCAVSLDVK